MKTEPNETKVIPLWQQVALVIALIVAILSTWNTGNFIYILAFVAVLFGLAVFVAWVVGGNK